MRKFKYRNRDYTNAVQTAIRRTLTTVSYPDSPAKLGIKKLLGERALFRQEISSELRKAKVPKALIKKLMKPAK